MDKELTTLDNGTWIVDRFEEDFAVLENAKTLDTASLPKIALPIGISPGDTLVMHDGVWRLDNAETAARGQRIQSMFDRIRARNQNR